MSTASNLVIDALLTRNSQAQLEGPEPTTEQIEIMVRAGLRAADHGWLQPTRFVCIQGEARQKLGEIFLHSQRDWQNLSEEKQKKLLNAPLRAPLIIAVISTAKPHMKIPVQEQWFASAAAAQNVLNAAWALQLGAIWRTGDVAFNPQVSAKLGLGNHEHIIGFIYIGHAKGEPKKLPVLNVHDFMQQWQG